MPIEPPHRRTLSIYLYEGDPVSKRDSQVRAAVAGIDNLAPHRRPAVDIQVHSHGSYGVEEVIGSLSHGQGVVMIVVNEREISKLTDGKLPRIACASIEFGFDLLKELGNGSEIYFVVRGEITGVDVLSLLLSGARGVIEADSLASEVVIARVARAMADPDKKKNRVLVGDPYRKLDSLVQMAKGRWQIAEQHWSLLLALGEVPTNKLRSKGPPTQGDIAIELDKYRYATGYVINSNTLRKLPPVLKLVSDELNRPGDDYDYDPEDDPGDSGTEAEEAPDADEGTGDEASRRSEKNKRKLNPEQRAELPSLPIYIRQLGFPSRLLRIRGVNESHLHSRLYKGVNDLFVGSSVMENGIELATVTLPPHLQQG